MSARRLRLSMRGMTLTRIFAAVVALDIIGAVVAAASGIADDSIVLIGTPLSAPFTFVAVQGIAVLAATRYRVGGVVLALLWTVSIMSGFFDGSFNDADLTAAHRVLQVALGIATVSLGAVALRSAIRPRRLEPAFG
jgi:uncharacterized membrane protein YpjA